VLGNRGPARYRMAVLTSLPNAYSDNTPLQKERPPVLAALQVN